MLVIIMDVCTVPTFNFCTKYVGNPGIIHDRTPERPPSFLGMDAAMTLQLIAPLIRKLRGSPMCLAYSFDMMSLSVCTTRHWQTSSRLVQKLDVCTVHVLRCDNVHSIGVKCLSDINFLCYCYTVPSCNSCTKCSGSPA